MCAVSMVADNFRHGLQAPRQDMGWLKPYLNVPPQPVHPTREEFDALKAEVVALREQLKIAKAKDDLDGNKDCEQSEKVAIVKRIAELVGVDLGGVI